jgi:hypothetical protein
LSGGVVIVPAVATVAGDAEFVAEGMPIPVRARTITAVQLTPKKLASISIFSGLLASASQPAIEAVLRVVMAEACTASLDAGLFSAAAATTARPAGILAGAVAVTPSAATPESESMAIDVGALVAAVAPIAGGSPIVIVASPRQAATLRLRAGSQFAYEILSSSALSDGTVLAVAVNAIASGLGSEVKFDFSIQATLHADTVPLPFGEVGTPNTISAPALSLWQANLAALRAILNLSWSTRAAGAVAIASGVSW